MIIFRKKTCNFTTTGFSGFYLLAHGEWYAIEGSAIESHIEERFVNRKM
ncbi:hypothetical protein KsCSTR_11420 [Candidatus Kuenenia stuttgartiensis]|uniref:Uncharacterized protein n=1 Tax=Kuenenia stuttgartiensis TaxID=174633 RepID=A0A6G7GM62_KUEST|nr:hypothetical protein KsCSTR_11420 [Candidatus Kuenenia stuttgartiensis]